MVAEKLVRDAVQCVVIDSASRAQDHARGGVIFVAEALEIGRRVALDGARGAKDRASERLVWIGLVKSQVEGDIVRAVLRGRDLLQDHLPLAVHLVVRKGGV